MIRLDRVRTPEAVHGNFTDPKRLAKALELLETQREVRAGRLSRHDWKNKSAFWKPAKEQLFCETHDKCAYCECPTATVAYGDVEHFRPKSKYWWLAYCYDNYLVSCAVCNQAYKSDHFPISGPLWLGPKIDGAMTDADLEALAGELYPDGRDVAAVQRLINAHDAEQADLVNPYYEDPADYFAYVALKGIGEVRVVATNHQRAKKRVAAAEEVFGINRLELCQFRYKIFRTFRVLWLGAERQDVPQDLRDECNEQLAEMIADDAPFSGMLRFFSSAAGPVISDGAIA
jgi:hypothetical protein